MARGYGNTNIQNTTGQTTSTRKSRSIFGALRGMARFALPLLVIFAGVFGFILMGVMKPDPDTKSEPPRAAPVLTAQAELRSVELAVQAQGEVRPRTEINLAAQIGGKIAYVSPNFLEGGQFRKGDTLLRIVSVDYDLRVTQTQANVAQAQTVLTRELSEADIARRDWDDLGEGEASPLSLREPQVAEARARLAAATAALDEAKLQQSRTVVRAPFHGRIREKTVSIGEYITPGQKLGRIYAVDIADVKLALTDADLAKLGLGIGFRATNAHPGPGVEFSATVAGVAHTWLGRIARTDSAYDPSTRILYAYAELNDPYGAGADNGTPMASGLFVSARIKGRTTEHSIIVPRNALRGTDKIYIANADNTLSIRTVKIASSDRYQVVVTSGLSGGETVIISPVRGVAEGMRIEVATTLAKNTTPTATTE
ncbi:MAG: efflux transporter periplasmic adaptor subunit [Robiginitomaculum sp.]|nr:MAG: efflux transporter periplasmic adaptor subunit [Robiginitomaculum sp.]